VHCRPRTARTRGASNGPVITSEVDGAVALVTLDRPASRNALTAAMIRSLAETLVGYDDDSSVRAIVLTGRDPAFCAGLDLADLAKSEGQLAKARTLASTIGGELIPTTTKPMVGAVNGPTVTGGLEVALACDFLIASERATFADTHARVGVMPGAGMTIRLPQAVGMSRARQMSLTGNFVDASTALSWGLVNEVVAHDTVVERAVELAGAIAESDPSAITELRSMYDTFAGRSGPDALAEEARRSARWMRERFDASALAASKDGIIKRGSSQQ
jgi:enoyl-CoA hydratase